MRKNMDFGGWNTDSEEYPLLREVNVDYFYLNLQADVNLDYPFSVSGSYNDVSREVNIDLEYNPDFFGERQWDQLYHKLVGIIRHELEHAFLASNYENIDSVGDSGDLKLVPRINNAVKYLLNRSEREVFIRGFLLRAKKTKVPAMDLIEGYIRNLIFGPDDGNRDRTIYMLFSGAFDELILYNGLTIRETYTRLISTYKKRLAEIRSGSHVKDIKRK